MHPVLSALSATICAALWLAAPATAQDVVKLITVEPNSGANTRQFFGSVVARQSVDLAFQVAGQITRLPVIEGQMMPRNSLIGQLDLEPFELALEQTRLQKAQADRAVARYEQLSGTSVSQVSLDDAVTQAALTAVALRNAEYALEHATLSAPYDALVAERLTENFTTIQAGAPVVRLHDMSELRIQIDVPEVLFQRAGIDPDVSLTATFPASDTVFALQLREFQADTSDVGQSFQITLGMAPPKGLRILPGSSVTVTATLGSEQSALLVPPTALVAAGDGLSAFVFAPGADDLGTVSKVAVTARPLASGQMQILSGLNTGDQIVAMGGHALADGQQVRRFAGFGQ